MIEIRGVAGAPPRAVTRPRSATVFVDRTAIARNVRQVLATTQTPVMAVVKADGFGHGDVAATALASGATWLGVATLDEAFRLRAQGITAPTLSWLNSVHADWRRAVAERVDVAVTSAEQLYAIGDAAASLGTRARVHLHLDVGMAREGAPSETWSALCVSAAALERAQRIRVVGIMGHLSHAEDPGHPNNAAERQRFVNGVRVAMRRGLTPSELHLAATAAALHLPNTRFTLSRVGAGLYGIDPAGAAELSSALTLTVPVAQVRDVAPGTGVGYGHAHTTGQSTKLAVLPIGYGDGLPRAAEGRAEVSIHGRRCPVVGRISMDQIVVDIGALDVSSGDVAVVMGPGRFGEASVGEWAGWSGTIEHELITRIGVRESRVQRSVSATRWAR